MPELVTRPIVVLGIPGDDLARADRRGLLALEAIEQAGSSGLVAGGRRHLGAWRAWCAARAPHTSVAIGPEVVEIAADPDSALRTVAMAAHAHRPVVVLASGDPGFFGIVRALRRMVDGPSLQVLPAPSSVSLAFARLGLPWDNAVVVSAHGRPLENALSVFGNTASPAASSAASSGEPQVLAVLTSPESPPEQVAKGLIARRGPSFRPELVAVCSNLDTDNETVFVGTLDEVAARAWDPLSVVVVADKSSPASQRSLAWGLPESHFEHRGGMVTKAEVRAVALGKLALPLTGVLWDVGSGSGSVAIECARLAPGVSVHALDRDPEAAALARRNSTAHAVDVTVHEGNAPEALAELPDPDRAFVGGGGVAVLEAVVARLRPGGRIVATYAALDRACAAADLLGGLVQVGVSRAARLRDGAWHLQAMNPVFVAFGPEGDDS